MVNNEAYAWVLREASENRRDNATTSHVSVEDWACWATERFSVLVIGDSLRHKLRKGEKKLMKTGPSLAIGNETFKTIEYAVLSKVFLTQKNGEAEPKENDMISFISSLGKVSSPRNLWRKIKAENAVDLKLSKEQQVEPRRQMWTTEVNLKDWFERWEDFFIEYGFGDDDSTGHVVFSEEQKRRICNMDETKFSTDVYDGGIGGRPANSVIISDTTRAGTGTNKSSLSSTLTCGSNAAGEPLPVHVMFSSDTQEENYSIDYRWIADFPRVQGVFGHEDVHEYCTQLMVNDKGGSDCRVLNQCLTGYQARLYPDAADVTGKRLLYKIDGVSGRLDEESLAEKRARDIYLFKHHSSPSRDGPELWSVQV
jgi:hypothetical protein